MNKPGQAMIDAGSRALASSRLRVSLHSNETKAVAREIYQAMERQRMRDERNARQAAVDRRAKRNTPWPKKTITANLEAFATCSFRKEDVQHYRPQWSLEKCQDWLADNIKTIEDGMESDGGERIEFWLDRDDSA